MYIYMVLNMQTLHVYVNQCRSGSLHELSKQNFLSKQQAMKLKIKFNKQQAIKLN